jgi:hypothetical protein
MGYRFSKSSHSWTPGSFPTGPVLLPGYSYPSPYWQPQPQIIAVASPPTVIQVPVPVPYPVPVPTPVPTPVQISVPSPVVPASMTPPPAIHVVSSPSVQVHSPRHGHVVMQPQDPTPREPPGHRPPSPQQQRFVQVDVDNCGGAAHSSSLLFHPQHQGHHSPLVIYNFLTPLHTPLNQQAQLPEPHPGPARQ